MWKRYANYQGGTADPMIVSWPAQIKEAGIRTQYTHAIDIVPTDLRLLGVELPEVSTGARSIPIEGESFAASLHDQTPRASRRSSTRCSAPAASTTTAGRPHP